MAAATDTGRVASQDTATATSHTISIDSAPSPGQLLVVLVRWPAAPGTVTFPAGWTLLRSDQTDASDDVQEVWWKYADGSEGASISVSTGSLVKMAAICWRITNGKNEAPAISATTVFTTTANTANPASVAPTGGTQDTLYIAMMGLGGELNQPTAGPAGYSNFIAQNSGVAGALGTNACVGGASKAATASASDDAGTFTHPAANLGGAAWTIAIRYAVYVPPPATVGTAGSPGTWNGVAPANFAALSGITASPTRAWYDTEWVVLGDASLASWNGSAWVVGKGTAAAPNIIPASTFKDDFRGPTVTAAWWPTNVGATIDGSGSTGRLKLPAVLGGTKVESRPLDMTNQEVTILDFPAPKDGATNLRRWSFKILNPANETSYVEIYVEEADVLNTVFYKAYKNGALVSNGTNQISHDPTYDAAFRIRNAAGRLYMESGQVPSPPLTGAWGFGAWIDVPVTDLWDMTNVIVRLSQNRIGSGADSIGYADQVNLRPTEVGPDPPASGDALTLDLTDTVGLADLADLVVTVSVAHTLDLSDSVSTADSLAPPDQGHGLALADTVTPLADVLSQVWDMGLTLSDTLALADALGIQADYVLDFIDSVALTDLADFQVVAGGQDLTLDLGDTAALADSLGLAHDALLDLADSLTGLGDTLTWQAGIVLDLADNISLADALTLAADLGLDLTDTVPLADLLGFQSDLTLDLADSVSLLDQTAFGADITAADSVPLDDVLALALDHGLPLADTVTLQDLLDLQSVLPLDLADTLSLADALVLAAAIDLQFADSVALADLLSFAAGVVLDLGDTIPLDELLDLSVGVNLTFSDTVPLADLLALALDTTQSLADTVSLADSLAFTSLVDLAPADTVPLSDLLSLVHGVGLSLDLSDSVATADDLSTTAALGLSLADAVTTVDALSAVVEEAPVICTPDAVCGVPLCGEAICGTNWACVRTAGLKLGGSTPDAVEIIDNIIQEAGLGFGAIVPALFSQPAPFAPGAAGLSFGALEPVIYVVQFAAAPSAGLVLGGIAPGLGVGDGVVPPSAGLRFGAIVPAITSTSTIAVEASGLALGAKLPEGLGHILMTDMVCRDLDLTADVEGELTLASDTESDLVLVGASHGDLVLVPAGSSDLDMEGIE